MTDLITAEDAKKLLDGSTPGPWEWTTGRFSNNPHLSPNILLLAFDGGGPDGVDPNDAANARLIAAAPDLARTVIALHAQLADAHAAQAMVVERCAEEAVRTTAADGQRNIKDQWRAEIGEEVASAIRDLAPIDGLALVRELRAESETRHQLHLEQVRITNEWIAECDRLAAANAALEAKVAGLRRDALILLAQIDGVEDATGEAPEGEDALLVAEIRTALAKSRVACMAAEADRDRLAAANAALEAKVAGLAEALKKADTALSDEGYRETQWPRPQIRAALATQEAGTC